MMINSINKEREEEEGRVKEEEKKNKFHFDYFNLSFINPFRPNINKRRSFNHPNRNK